MLDSKQQKELAQLKKELKTVQKNIERIRQPIERVNDDKKEVKRLKDKVDNADKRIDEINEKIINTGPNIAEHIKSLPKLNKELKELRKEILKDNKTIRELESKIRMNQPSLVGPTHDLDWARGTERELNGKIAKLESLAAVAAVKPQQKAQQVEGQVSARQASVGAPAGFQNPVRARPSPSVSPVPPPPPPVSVAANPQQEAQQVEGQPSPVKPAEINVSAGFKNPTAAAVSPPPPPPPPPAANAVAEQIADLKSDINILRSLPPAYDEKTQERREAEIKEYEDKIRELSAPVVAQAASPSPSAVGPAAQRIVADKIAGFKDAIALIKKLPPAATDEIQESRNQDIKAFEAKIAALSAPPAPPPVKANPVEAKQAANVASRPQAPSPMASSVDAVPRPPVVASAAPPVVFGRTPPANLNAILPTLNAQEGSANWKCDEKGKGVKVFTAKIDGKEETFSADLHRATTDSTSVVALQAMLVGFQAAHAGDKPPSIPKITQAPGSEQAWKKVFENLNYKAGKDYTIDVTKTMARPEPARPAEGPEVKQAASFKPSPAGRS